MTTRIDVSYDLSRSPRIAEVASPSTEMVMQDYVDTTRPFESSFEAMSHTFLMDASGKQDLGGGEFVTITVEERDLKLSFEARTTAAETGTVTTGSAAPIKGEISFTDTAATFISNGVVRGSLVINFTDQSVADVVSVDAEDTLTTKTLVNGIGNTFDVADVYHIFNIIQCTSTGGNLVATDALDVTFPAILPTAFTQIIQTKASSGTITNLTTIETQLADVHGQVQRSIFIDTESIANGNGYQQTPYNNWSDAVDDAEANGIKSLVLLADATVDRLLKNFTIFGVGRPIIDMNGQNLDKSHIIHCDLTGAMLGAIVANNCTLISVTGMDGHFDTCDLSGTCEIATAGNVVMHSNPHSNIAGLNRPTFSMNAASTGAKFSLRGYSGGLNLTNCNQVNDEVTLEFAQGKCTLAASNTAGNISVRGLAQFTDNSAGSIVDTTALINRLIVENDVWNALLSDHTVTGSFGEFIVRRLLTVAKFFSLRT